MPFPTEYRRLILVTLSRLCKKSMDAFTPNGVLKGITRSTEHWSSLESRSHCKVCALYITPGLVLSNNLESGPVFPISTVSFQEANEVK